MNQINFYNLDCMEFFKGVPANHYELAIVDPPFGFGAVKQYNKKFRKDSAEWNKEIPKPEYFEELFRVSKQQIIWGANYFTKYLPPVKSWIVWDKDFNGDTNGFSDGELAWCSNNGKLTIHKLKANDGKQNAIIKIHPTQKPVELYEWLLMNYAKEGDKILDTHGGSMSIALACHNLSFKLDICELNKEYFDSAIKRFNQHTAQLRIY